MCRFFHRFMRRRLYCPHCFELIQNARPMSHRGK